MLLNLREYTTERVTSYKLRVTNEEGILMRSDELQMKKGFEKAGLEQLYIFGNQPFPIPHSPFPIPHSPFPIHHSPFTIPHSPFTIHHSPLTINH